MNEDSLSYKVRHWWWEHVTCSVNTFGRNIQRIVQYMPILWNGEDWDHTHLLALLQYKISRMSANIERNKNHVNWHIDFMRMRSVEKMLERMIRDDYARKEWNIHYKKWPRAKVVSVTMKSTAGTPEGDSVKRIWELEAQRRDADWDQCFKTLKGHLQAWWD